MKEELKEYLKKLLRENKTAEVFEELRKNPPRNQKLQDDITLLSSRFKRMEWAKQGALADSTSLAHEHNRINDALLNVINQSQPSNAFAATPNSGDVPPVKSNSKPMNWALIVLLFMGILVGTNLLNKAPTKVVNTRDEKIPTIFKLDGVYNGGSAMITRQENSLSIKLADNRPIANGVIIDGNSIMVNFTDHVNEMTGTLVNSNRMKIKWSDGSEWYKDKNP